MLTNSLKIICFSLFVFLLIGGCAFPPFYEPYPALDYVEISVEETPEYILNTFETAYPTARILTIEKESFRGNLRGYLIMYRLDEMTEDLFITTEGEIVSE